MEKQNGLPCGSVVKEWLTRDSLFIDDKGHIRARYIQNIRGAKQVFWHDLADIDTAIWQHFHILEHYLGQYVGLSRRRTRIRGELQAIGTVADSLLSVAKDYLGRSISVTSTAEMSIEGYVKRVLEEIGPVISPLKVDATVRIAGLVSQKPTVDRVLDTISAADLLTQRVKEILAKAQGVRRRLAKLQQKRRRCLSVIRSLYEKLSQMISDDQKEPLERWSKQRISVLRRTFSANSKSLIDCLEQVNVQPYLKRAQSSQIRALKHLPTHLEKGNYQTVRKIILRAISKLERVISEFDSRLEPKLMYLPKS